jgi:hypothetical protein
VTTAATKLRAAHANGPSRVETRDGREFRVFVLDEATRDEVLHRPTKIDSAIARQELDARGLMSAPTENGEGPGNTPEALRNPFMHVVSAGGADGGGLTAHRGVLQDNEYVDPDVLRKAVEEELGYTYEQIRSVYRQGPLTPEKRELRGIIDARMLALRRSGANMVELGRAIGFPIKASGNCAVLDNAIARAKANSQWFKNLAARVVAEHGDTLRKMGDE